MDFSCRNYKDVCIGLKIVVYFFEVSVNQLTFFLDAIKEKNVKEVYFEQPGHVKEKNSKRVSD